MVQHELAEDRARCRRKELLGAYGVEWVATLGAGEPGPVDSTKRRRSRSGVAKDETERRHREPSAA